MKLMLRIACGIAVSLLLASRPALGQRLHPKDVFKRVAPSVFVIEARSLDGRLVAQGSAVAVAHGIVATSCHIIDDEKLNLNKLFPLRPEGYTAVEVLQRVAAEVSKPRKQEFVVRQGKKKWGALVVLRWLGNGEICLLATLANDFLPVQTRPAESLEVGESVFAVGAPQGMELTMSEGIVSRLEKEDLSPPANLPEKEKYFIIERIQTTAPISPGSSGGGLFDSEGRLVGITTSTLEEGQNLNFAIPVGRIWLVWNVFQDAWMRK